MSMKITSKEESDRLISKLDLNSFAKINIKCLDDEAKKDIDKFLKENGGCKFAIRDSLEAGSKKFKNNLSAEEVLKNITGLSNFSITVSGMTYFGNKKLVGEIYISKNMDIWANVSTNPSFTTRDASLNPECALKLNIYDKRINQVPYLNYIIDYIFAHNLFDMIVEFSIFDKPLGTKHENVIIWELRTDY